MASKLLISSPLSTGRLMMTSESWTSLDDDIRKSSDQSAFSRWGRSLTSAVSARYSGCVWNGCLVDMECTTTQTGENFHSVLYVVHYVGNKGMLDISPTVVPLPTFWESEYKYSDCKPRCFGVFARVNMVHTCVVAGCRNRRTPGTALSFYRFPRDPERKQRWIAAVNREGWVPNEGSRLCSNHFISGKKSCLIYAQTTGARSCVMS